MHDYHILHIRTTTHTLCFLFKVRIGFVMELLRQSGGEHTRCIRIEAHIKDSKKLSDESRRYLRHDADNTGRHSIVESFFKGLVVV